MIVCLAFVLKNDYSDLVQKTCWTAQLNVSDDKIQGITHNFLNHPSVFKFKKNLS